MKIDDFAQIQIENAGIYRLLPDHKLIILLQALSQNYPLEKLIGTYGTLIRMFRGIKNLNQSQLATQADLERKAIYLLEEEKTSKPKSETHAKLVKVFGNEFDILAKQLKLIESK